jgi:hypothetical protein
MFTSGKNCTSMYMYLITHLLSFSSRELPFMSLSMYPTEAASFVWLEVEQDTHVPIGC